MVLLLLKCVVDVIVTTRMMSKWQRKYRCDEKNNAWETLEQSKVEVLVKQKKS